MSAEVPGGGDGGLNTTPTPAAACEAFQRFVGGLDRAGRTVVLHDSDADGVTAGVVLQRALERLGFTAVSRVAPTRERDAWSDANRALVAGQSPAALFVLDLGSRAEPLLAGVPACFIDHHRPDGVPPGATLISAYPWATVPCTSLLVHDLCASMIDVSDLEWVAAIGALSDIGDRASFEVVERAKKKHTGKALQEATALVNAARRVSLYQPEAAARALLGHADPKSLVRSAGPDVQALREAREEVRRELAEGKKAAPVFAGKVALVRVRSRCQIHPLLAQIWRTRLPRYIVVVANEGYLPGRVNFSVRSSGGESLIDFLRSIDLGLGEGSYGRGHDHATGGSLPFERFNLLLRKLGFPESVFARA